MRHQRSGGRAVSHDGQNSSNAEVDRPDRSLRSSRHERSEFRTRRAGANSSSRTSAGRGSTRCSSRARRSAGPLQRRHDARRRPAGHRRPWRGDHGPDARRRVLGPRAERRDRPPDRQRRRCRRRSSRRSSIVGCPTVALMRPTDPDGFRTGFATIQALWDGTVERARTFPAEALHRSVDGEWSFIQTLRHLNFATVCWVGHGRRRPQPVAPARPPVGRGARLGRSAVGQGDPAVAWTRCWLYERSAGHSSRASWTR